jgi:hypothetical protein
MIALRASDLSPAPILVIACGALSREILLLQQLNEWRHMQLKCLDPALHNRPQLIAGKLRAEIARQRPHYAHIFVAYADCGSAGEIDKVLAEEGIERLPGAHCYSVFAGEERFQRIADEELGTFFLTDFLVRHFERLVIKGLKLDRYPQLRDQYFGHYRRLVYLSQRPTEGLLAQARRAAATLDLRFQHRPCGYGDLQSGLELQVLKFAQS